MEANFALVQTQRLFLRLNFDILSTMNLKYEKKLLKLTVQWQSTKRHHVVFVERAKRGQVSLCILPSVRQLFFHFFFINAQYDPEVLFPWLRSLGFSYASPSSKVSHGFLSESGEGTPMKNGFVCRTWQGQKEGDAVC